MDLLIAVATGVAGALGTARKDVGDVLPGVAIAISLVPPLAVVGVAAQDGQGSLALGALLLFVTNLVALVAAGTVVFTALGYAREARSAAAGPPGSGRRRGAHVLVALSVLLVAVPLAADTFYEVVLDQQLDRASAAAAAWARSAPGTQFQGVAHEGSTYVVAVEGPATGAPPPALLRKLAGVLPPAPPSSSIRSTAGASMRAPCPDAARAANAAAPPRPEPGSPGLRSLTAGTLIPLTAHSSARSASPRIARSHYLSGMTGRLDARTAGMVAVHQIDAFCASRLIAAQHGAIAQAAVADRRAGTRRPWSVPARSRYRGTRAVR